MTPSQKTVFAVILAVTAGVGGYQAYRAASLQKQAQLEEQRQKPSLEQNAQLVAELAAITNRIAIARQENKQLLAQLEEIPRLRAERDRFQQKLNELMRARESEGSSVEAELTSWLGRTMSLKQRFDQWPGKKCPELQLLTEEDWLNATANRHLETEADCREAMADLRKTAKTKLAEIIQKALRQFSKSRNQQYPSNLSQLAPYLSPPADPSILDGYEVAKPGTVHAQIPNSDEIKAETWAIVEKGGLADEDYDMRIVIYQGVWFGGPTKPTPRK